MSDLDNEALLAPFTEEEVFAAIKGVNTNSVPGHDGLSVGFFQVMMAMFQDFYVGILDLSWLNFGIITLIPKALGASDTR